MSDNQQHPDWKQKDTGTTAGRYLQRLRREKNLSVQDVTEATKVSASNIRAIEEEAYDRLPADTFVRGLITLYGNYLGIDGSKVAAEYLAERERSGSTPARQKIIKENFPPTTLSPKKFAEPAHISSATIALLLLAIIILTFTGFCLYTSWNPFSFLSRQTESMQFSIQGIFGTNEQEETETEKGVTLPQEKSYSEKGEKSADITPKEGRTENQNGLAHGQPFYTLTALFLQESKVDVTIDGRAPTRATFNKGETVRWKADRTLKVVFDKPGAATLKLNDSPFTFPQSKDSLQPTLTLPDDLFDQ